MTEPTVILVPKALRGVLTLVAVDLRGARVDARLGVIDRYVEFARRHQLIREDQVPDLVEMLINGARLEHAVSELRSMSLT